MANHWQKGFLNLTWDEFRAQTTKLSQKISASTFPADLIVTIARGGMPLARILSDILSLPIASFTIQSYKDLKQASIPHLTYGIDRPMKGRKILLVDDVSDTGKTFIRGLAYLEELGAKTANVKTVALHYKPYSSFKPDFYVQKTSDWIIYPYETAETMKTLAKKWSAERVKPDEIRKRFRKWQFEEELVEITLRNM